MKIKVISLWEPWATLVGIGAKRFETRSWPTNYRGPLLICAAAKRDGLSMSLATTDPAFRSALAGVPLSFGRAVCVATLVRVWRVYSVASMVEVAPGLRSPSITRTPGYPEHLFGDFGIGRYAWELAGVRRVSFPVKGAQGLFEVDVEESLLH